jgi:hypothetical protein
MRSSDVISDRLQPSGAFKSGRCIDGQPFRSYFSEILICFSIGFFLEKFAI